MIIPNRYLGICSLSVGGRCIYWCDPRYLCKHVKMTWTVQSTGKKQKINWVQQNKVYTKRVRLSKHSAEETGVVQPWGGWRRARMWQLTHWRQKTKTHSEAHVSRLELSGEVEEWWLGFYGVFDYRQWELGMAPCLLPHILKTPQEGGGAEGGHRKQK